MHNIGEEKAFIRESFHALFAKEELHARVIEFFPFPIQVYTPDGILVLTNKACLDMLHIRSKHYVVEKFNVLTDPVIDEWGEGVREQIAKSFKGETVQFDNLKVPAQGIINRFASDELCFDIRLLNITCFPIYNNQSQLEYVVHVFVTSRLYNGKEEIVKAKEYIENHWLEKFDLDKAARSVNLSRHHFSRLFKKYANMTPLSYYQDVKIRKLQEKLHNTNIAISEAFSACGVDYNGNYAKLFREKVGMTPSEYRKSFDK